MEVQIPFNFMAIFLFLALLLTLSKQWRRSKNLTTAKSLPPGPRKLPLIGSMHHLIGLLPHRTLANLAQKYGPLMHLHLGEISAIVVSSPRLAQEIMKTHDLAFSSRPESLVSNIIFYNGADIIYSPYGNYWRQARKICIQELLSARSVQSFWSIREDEFSHLVESIRVSAGKPINLSENFISCTSSIVSRAAFGRVCSDQDMFFRLMKEAATLAGGFNVHDVFPSLKILHVLSGMKPKVMDIHQRIDKILESVLNAHKENRAKTKKGNGESGQEDLIDVLLRVKESGDHQFQFTKDHIKAIIFDMFAAGTDTTSTAIEWTMSEMLRNPNVMAKVQNEVRQAFKGRKTIDESDIQGLRYIKLVIKESLRLHPPGPLILRECREQCELDGYTIPIKTMVLINTWAIGRDPEYWNDPERFHPERFELNPIDFTGKHYEFIPFGAGRRICPGMSFGLASVEHSLALLLYHFNWKMADGINPHDLDMTENAGIATSRKIPLRLIATLYDPSIHSSCQ